MHKDTLDISYTMCTTLVYSSARYVVSNFPEWYLSFAKLHSVHIIRENQGHLRLLLNSSVTHSGITLEKLQIYESSETYNEVGTKLQRVK